MIFGRFILQTFAGLQPVRQRFHEFEGGHAVDHDVIDGDGEMQDAEFLDFSIEQHLLLVNCPHPDAQRVHTGGDDPTGYLAQSSQ